VTVAAAARELDRSGYGDTAAHRLDARVKLVVTVFLVLCVASFEKGALGALLPFFAWPLLLLLLGRVPLRPVGALLLAASPFVLMAGAASPFLDRAPAQLLLGLPVTSGLRTFLSVGLRFAVCSSAALALVGVTSLPGLLRALRQLGTPAPLTAQLALLYRYLFLLADEGERLSAARRLRDPRRRLPTFSTARALLSSLLVRTLDRGDRVYQCMAVRGFTGEFPALSKASFRAADAALLVAALAALAAFRWKGLS
jgi:cobalt/nickel transport system permease protein